MNDAMALRYGAKTVSALGADTKPVVGTWLQVAMGARSEAHVLLYPEGMVKLNSSAAAILSRCDGVRTVADIVADIEGTYGVTGLSADVAAFCGARAGEGLAGGPRMKEVRHRSTRTRRCLH